MKITMKDGQSYELLSNSNEHEVMIPFASFDIACLAIRNFTDDNLSKFTIDDTEYENRHLSEVRIYFDAGAEVEVHFCLIPTAAQQMIYERVAAYEDKAAGYDVLTGGEANG